MVGTGPWTLTTLKFLSSRAIRGQQAKKEDSRNSPSASLGIWAEESTLTVCPR